MITIKQKIRINLCQSIEDFCSVGCNVTINFAVTLSCSSVCLKVNMLNIQIFNASEHFMCIYMSAVN